MKVSGQLHATSTLPPGRTQLNWRLGGYQAWSRRFGVENNLLPLPGIETPIIQFADQSLGQLRYNTSS
jgi:hypothetical protein